MDQEQPQQQQNGQLNGQQSSLTPTSFSSPTPPSSPDSFPDSSICPSSTAISTPPSSPNFSKASTTNDVHEIPKFTFSEDDFIQIQSGCDSKFDLLLKRRWNNAANQNVLNYSIKHRSLQGKIISPEKYLFVAALLRGRAPGKRRDPQNFPTLLVPFDPEKFNFTKISDKREILLEFQSLPPPESDDDDDESRISKPNPPPPPIATIIVNKSPIEYCSSLLVPSLDSCLPQVLTEDSIRLALNVLCLSDRQSLRLGYNSPGAMASVNHLHWHIYYCEYKLAIEDLPIKDHILQRWPMPAIVYELTDLCDESISEVISKTMKIIDFCLENGHIAHNLFLTRTGSGSIRLFIWLMEPKFGAKNGQNVNVAFCEFSGFFICKTDQIFQQMDEIQCLQLLKSIQSRHQMVLHLL